MATLTAVIWGSMSAMAVMPSGRAHAGSASEGAQVTRAAHRHATCNGKTATITARPGQHHISGTAGNDVIVGTSGADVIKGLGGHDTICGGKGNDVIYGGAGNDRIFGGFGNDRLFGGRGIDRIHGGVGNDRLAGNNGDDRLYGDAGHDVLRGGKGDDDLTGGPNADRLLGGPGDDTLDRVPDGVIQDVPPDPGNTTSFQWTSGINIPEVTTRTVYSGCPVGWYVRPAQPDAATPTDINASFSYRDDGPVFHIAADDGVSVDVPTTGDGHIFQNLQVSFYNSSGLHHETASITFWCDKVPDWYANPPTAAAIETGSLTGNCYYCYQNSQLINLSTGMALDPSNAAEGTPLLVQNPTGSAAQNWYLQGQTGGSVFKNGLATYGLWKFSDPLEMAVAENSVNYNFTAASATPPNDGQFYYENWGAGQVYGAAMLINTATNNCLAAPGGAGSNAVPVACDATDKSQWWKVKDPA